MAEDHDRVVVYLDAHDLGSKQAVGTLGRRRSGSKSVISFAYDRGWVSAPDSFPVDPSLQSALIQLEQTNALIAPEEAEEQGLILLDPPRLADIVT